MVTCSQGTMLELLVNESVWSRAGTPRRICTGSQLACIPERSRVRSRQSLQGCTRRRGHESNGEVSCSALQSCVALQSSNPASSLMQWCTGRRRCRWRGKHCRDAPRKQSSQCRSLCISASRPLGMSTEMRLGSVSAACGSVGSLRNGGLQGSATAPAAAAFCRKRGCARRPAGRTR